MYLGVGSFIIIKMTPKQKYNSVTQNKQLCQMLLFNTKPFHAYMPFINKTHTVWTHMAEHRGAQIQAPKSTPST